MKGKNLIRFFCFFFILSIYSVASPKSLRILGSNKLSYWQWREAKKNFLEDILNVDAIYGNFSGNIEGYIYEPSFVKSSLRKEGVRRRFVEYKNPRWSLRLGNSYQCIGRGLILYQTPETPGNIDRDIDGFFSDYTIKFLTLSLLSGKPKNILFSNGEYTITNDTTDIIQGGNLDFNLFPSFPFALNFIRLSSEDPGVEKPRQVYLYGFNANFLKGPLIIHTEFAKRKGWDRLQFSNSQGIGIYSSITLFTDNLSLCFDFLSYDSIGYGGPLYRYNAPPTGNLDSYSINRATDERGWMLDLTTNPFGSWYLKVNRSVLSAISSDSLGFNELYTELKGNIWENRTSILLSVKNLEYRKPEPSIDKKTEWIPQIVTMNTIGTHSVNLGFEPRIVKIDTVNFIDNAISIDIGLFPYLSIASRWEIRTKEVLLESEGTEWKVIDLRWDISDAHTIAIMAGSEKGGLVCSGGVCRVEEPFDGVKINVLSRF